MAIHVITATTARLLVDRLRFEDRTRTKPFAPLQMWYIAQDVAKHADAARAAGDMVTYRRLMDWIAVQRSSVRRQRLQQESPE